MSYFRPHSRAKTFALHVSTSTTRSPPRVLVGTRNQTLSCRLTLSTVHPLPTPHPINTCTHQDTASAHRIDAPRIPPPTPNWLRLSPPHATLAGADAVRGSASYASNNAAANAAANASITAWDVPGVHEERAAGGGGRVAREARYETRQHQVLNEMRQEASQHHVLNDVPQVGHASGDARVHVCVCVCVRVCVCTRARSVFRSCMSGHRYVCG